MTLIIFTLLALCFGVSENDGSLPSPNNHGVIELNPENWQKVVMHENYDVMVEFYSPYCSYCQQLEPTWNELGGKFKKEDSVLITRIDYSNPKNYIEGYQVRGVPTIYIFPASKKSSPVLFQSQRTLNNFIEFIMTHSDHKVDVPVHHKSLPAPTNNNGPVVTVVGETWQQIVLNKEKHVFVNFFAPWCPYSQRLKPIWEELGKKMAEHTDLVIADFDGTENEVPGLTIYAFPTTTLYRAGDKANPLQFRGPTRSVAAYEEWLRAQIPDVFQEGHAEAQKIKDKHQRFDDSHLVREITEENLVEQTAKPRHNIAVLFYAEWDEHKTEQLDIWDDVAFEYAYIDSIEFYQMEASKAEKLGITTFPAVRIYPVAIQSGGFKNLARNALEGDVTSTKELVRLGTLAQPWQKQRYDQPPVQPPSCHTGATEQLSMLLGQSPTKLAALTPPTASFSGPFHAMATAMRKNFLDGYHKPQDVPVPDEIRSALFSQEEAVAPQTYKGKELTVQNLKEFIQEHSNPTQPDILVSLLKQSGVQFELDPPEKRTNVEKAHQTLNFDDIKTDL